MDQKEVACPPVVHNTAFRVVIESFEPLNNGRAKSKRKKCFCIKGHSNVSKAFSKSRKSSSPGNFFSRGVINNTIN